MCGILIQVSLTPKRNVMEGKSAIREMEKIISILDNEKKKKTIKKKAAYELWKSWKLLKRVCKFVLNEWGFFFLIYLHKAFPN